MVWDERSLHVMLMHHDYLKIHEEQSAPETTMIHGQSESIVLSWPIQHVLLGNRHHDIILQGLVGYYITSYSCSNSSIHEI